ncbi:unnamed protein product [Aphanomyces euteiches]
MVAGFRFFGSQSKRIAISPSNVPIPTEISSPSEPLLLSIDDSSAVEGLTEGSSGGSPSKHRRRQHLPWNFHHSYWTSENSSKLYGLALIAGGNVFFSFMAVLLKVAAKYMSSEETVFWRSAVALVLNLGVQLYLKIPPFAVEPRFRALLALRAIIGYAAMTLSFYAYSAMVLSEAQVIICSAPIITFLFVRPCSVCFLGEKLDQVNLICVLVSFVGVVCVARPAFLFGGATTASPQASFIPVICSVLSAVLIGVINILIRKLNELNTWTLVTYFLIVCTICSAAKITFFEQGIKVPNDPVQIITLIGIGVLGCLGQIMVTKGFQVEKDGIAAAMMYINTVCVMIWDVTLLGVSLHFWSVFGAVVICGGAFVIAYRKTIKK